MPVNPICEVREGVGPFVPTTNGVDVTPGSLISVQLVDSSSVTAWYLEVVGTDELSTAPGLINVNNITHLVLTPNTVVTFLYPSGAGRALLFRSTVQGPGGPLESRFTIYSQTLLGARVGAVNERKEGDTQYGWITKVNPLIREGASVIYYDDNIIPPPLGENTVQGAIDVLKTGSTSFIAAGDLTGTPTNQTVVGLQGIPFSGTPAVDGLVPTYNLSQNEIDWTSSGGGSSLEETYGCAVTVAVRDVVYMTNSGTLDRSISSNPATVPVVGIVTAKPTVSTATVRFAGIVAGFSGLTPRFQYFLGASAGSLTLTPSDTSGSVVQVVGIAMSTTTLLVAPQNFILL